MSSWDLIGIDHINCVIQNSIPREGREKCKCWYSKQLRFRKKCNFNRNPKGFWKGELLGAKKKLDFQKVDIPRKEL